MRAKHSSKYLLWMDLEMTGLDPQVDQIIEVATIVTDWELEIVAKGPEIVISQPAELFSKMDQWNQTHHAKSGLWDKVQASKTTLREAEAQTLSFIKQYFAPQEGILAGNSIWQDRRFLARLMKDVDQYLNYRMVDVSTLKILAQNWYSDVKFVKKGSHRALDDIIESIDELKYYRGRILTS